MRSWLIHATCLLLLWTMTEFVSSDREKENAPLEEKIIVSELFNAITLSCSGLFDVSNPNDSNRQKMMNLPYNDELSGEYKCINDTHSGPKIFVKFRSCDNCIELDLTSTIAMAGGDLVATAVIGFAVYLLASVVQKDSGASNKKRSDRKQLLPEEPRGSSEHYQDLRFKSHKDEYDRLNTKR